MFRPPVQAVEAEAEAEHLLRLHKIRAYSSGQGHVERHTGRHLMRDEVHKVEDALHFGGACTPDKQW